MGPKLFIENLGTNIMGEALQCMLPKISEEK